ncbi:hypothetical protein ACHAW5_000039 [Stephanodiscus triporus]|uniref:Uncharacterized protein n=1 Tax=Stephanodiscus triporus TaxID=2934178 RepID=A0ABD3MIS7_9STRA
MHRKNRILRRDHAAITPGVVRFLVIALIFAICCVAEDGGKDGASKTGRSNDEAAARDEWYADDPYMPTDDYFIQQIQEEIDAERNENNYRNESIRSRLRQMLMYFVASSVSILGFSSAVLCTSMFLYDLRMEILMRRYARKGVVVDGRILASDPDIEETMKTANAVKHHPKIQNNDSYSIMTDDESYQAGSRSVHSFSVRSGANEVEEGQKRDMMEEKEWPDPVGSEVSFADGSNLSSTAKSRPKYIAKAVTSERKQMLSDMRFHVIVEYDDVSYHDAISQFSSEIIRKSLWIVGEDVEGTSNNFSTPVVKLYVLQDKPKSGYPCGEVRRARSWQKRFSFKVHIMLGVFFVIFGAIVAKNMLSPALFLLYIGLSLLQVPFVNCFLQKSFSKLLSQTYLEDGYKMPSKLAKKSMDKQKMMTALKQGTSFGYLQ